MKPRASNLLLAVLLLCLLAAMGGPSISRAALDSPVAETPLPLDATSPSPSSAVSASPAASAKPGKGAKPGKQPKVKDPNATPKPRKPPKEIPFVLPIGNDATHIVIPENSSTGTLLMNLMALKASRVTNELVQMNETNIDVNHADGSEDFHIALPACVFNLKTHIINSDNPVTVRTPDFELTGEKMEFDTVDRTGKLLGHVHMHIHNLKQIAGPPQTPSTP